MIQLIIMVWSLLCPNPTHTILNHGNCPLMHIQMSSTEDDDDDDDGDTGGETGNFPPKLPPPPPPPPFH